MWRELDQRERELDQLAEVMEELLHLKAEVAWAKSKVAEAVVGVEEGQDEGSGSTQAWGGLIVTGPFDKSSRSVPVINFKLVCLDTNFGKVLSPISETRVILYFRKKRRCLAKQVLKVGKVWLLHLRWRC